MANISQLSPDEYTAAPANASGAPAVTTGVNIQQLNPTDYSVQTGSTSTPSPYEPITGQGVAGDIGNAVDNAGKWLSSWNAPGTQIGNAIGTLGGYLYTEATNPNAAKYYDLNAPTPFQVAGDTANALATAAVPEDTGILKMAGLGAGSAASQDIASGGFDPTKPTASSVSKLLNDSMWGGIFGAGIQAAGGMATHFGEQEAASTGVTDAVKEAITTMPEDITAEAIAGASNHGKSLTGLNTPNAMGQAEQEFNNKTTQVLNMEKIAGQAVGDAKKAQGNASLVMTTPQGILTGTQTANAIFDSVNQQMQDVMGYGMGDVTQEGLQNLTSNTHSPILYQLPGKYKALASGEEDSLKVIQDQMELLKAKPTASVAADVIYNLKKEGKIAANKFAGNASPIEGLANYAIDQVNASLRETSPDLARANYVYSNLASLVNDISQKAGTRGQVAPTFLERALAYKTNMAVLPTMNKIDFVASKGQNLDSLYNFFKGYNAIEDTGNFGAANLYAHNAVANEVQNGNLRNSLLQRTLVTDWATNMLGDASSRELLAKRIAQGAAMSEAQGISKWLGYAKGFANKVGSSAFRKISPDVEDYAMSVAKGRPLSMSPIWRNSIDKFTNAPESAPTRKAIGDFLHKNGITGQNIDTVIGKMLKTGLFLGTTNPQNFDNSNQDVPYTQLPVSMNTNRSLTQ